MNDTVGQIAVGSNLPTTVGNSADTCREALRRLGAHGLRMVACSAFYQTPAFPAGSGPDFCNAVASFATNLGPTEVLDILHKVEADMGRDRRQRWAPRTLDLDLIAMGDLVLPDRAVFQDWLNLAPSDQQARAPHELILPHPRLHERAFVLVPLADVAPTWRHPVLGQTALEMRDALPAKDLAEITILDVAPTPDSLLVKPEKTP